MTAPAFQDFQHAFAAYLRQAPRAAPPPGVPARRAGVYRELVFANISGILDAAFPVCRTVLGERRWRRLNRTFLRDWPLHSPWFREIPAEFAHYLREGRIALARPAWLADLAHYEWLELAVDVMDVPDGAPAEVSTDELLTRPLLLNPSLRLFSSAWPVHLIGPEWRPSRPRETHLAIHRDASGAVRFTELNALTARLLGYLAEPERTGRSAVLQLAEELAHPDPERLLAFAGELVHGLCDQGLIVGVRS